MNSAKHPKKKRRIDDVQGDNHSLPGPSKEVMPLVAPQLVKKSSKDPNRSMYPFSKQQHRTKKSSISPPSQSEKASVRYRKLPQKIKKEKLKFVDSTPCNISSNEALQGQSASDLNKSNTKYDCDSSSTNTGKQFNLCARKGNQRTKSSHFNSAYKILKNLKHSSSLKKQTKIQNSAKPSEADLTKELPGTSGWKKKEIAAALTEINNEFFFKSTHHCYGLVDIDSGSEENGMDFFKILPTHIIENILCQIPVLDLMNCRLVCTRWLDIIDNEKFMEWKKLYYKYKKVFTEPYSDPKKKLNEIILQNGYGGIEDCVGSLLKYLGKGFNHVPSTDMYNLLIQNPKGELADRVLSERFPKFEGKDSRVWCQFAIAILICETVWDIFYLYKSLFTTTSSCPQPDIIEAMYCVATFLLFFQSWDSINCGLHFRLYYVLYLIENHIPKFQREKLKILKGLPSQQKQSIHSCSTPDSNYLTYEQMRVLNHQFDMNQKIRIIALAGTGKTTTLLHLSRLYPQMKFLNLVFTKSVSDEAKRKFPKNVTCKTAHSLAYTAVGQPLGHKLTSKLRPFDFIGHLKHKEEHVQVYAYANLVLSTINNFTVSSSTVMSLSHVPMQDCSHRSLAYDNRDKILMDAYKIWQKMTNENDPFKITHDVYLKLYHLKQPILDKYQCIMVDEAQDCNPVILDIVISQTIPVIFVGDPHQQIYGFRGAQNALRNITATHTYYLTKSFRFGPEIAYIASCIHEILLSSKSATIVGSTKDTFINGEVGGQYAVISRTNVMLFNEALRMIVFKRLKKNEPTVINAAFVGGFNSYGFDQISDIYKLKITEAGDRQITDKFISRFKTFSDLANYARYSDDSDLLSKIDIVNQHDHNISEFITILREKCNHPIELANVVFSTAHKAKGLEFDTVCLTDDYPISAIPSYSESIPAREEASILYVALTRAKSYLLLPEKIKKVLYRAHEKFEYPVSTESILKDNLLLNLNCVQCDATFNPHTVLTMVRRKMIMASEREISGGPLCMKCCSDPYMRPDIHINGLIMYLDATNDNAHRFMSSIVGPLPTDPPIVHDRFSEFHNADRVFVINLNVNIP